MIDGWLLHSIFSHLPPRDLISCAAVCREFYAIARADKAWERHKQRVLKYCPTLQSIFEKHGQETDGKRVLKRHKKQTPQGTWYIFARFLMLCPFQLAVERCKSKFAVNITSDVVEAAAIFSRFPAIYKKSTVGNWAKRSINNASMDYFIHFRIDYERDTGSDLIFLSIRNSQNIKIIQYTGFLRQTDCVAYSSVSTPFLKLIHDCYCF